MFERLNRCSEVLLLGSVMLVPFCHFLDKEGYHFKWSWFGSRFSMVSIIVMLIELLELKFTSYSSNQPCEERSHNKMNEFMKDNEIEDPLPKTRPSTIQLNATSNELSWKEFMVQITCKLYNVVLVYLISNLVKTLIEKNFKYSNYIFDQLFVISVVMFIFKCCMIHQQSASSTYSLGKSFEFALFCFNLVTNIFLILLTVSDKHKESLTDYLNYLRYRDIEDIAYFLEVSNILISLKFFYLGFISKNQIFILAALFILTKILFFNANFTVNLIVYIMVPVLNGMLFFEQIDVSPKQDTSLFDSIKQFVLKKRVSSYEI